MTGIIPIDVVRPSNDFVEGRLAAVRTLFDALPERLRSSYASGKDRKPTPVAGILRDAVKRQDFSRVNDAISVLNDGMTEDDVDACVITGLMSRLVYDAEFAAATDVYADAATVFSGYLSEIEENGRSGDARAVRTCLDMNLVLGCIEDRAYGSAEKNAAKLADHLERSDDPDVRAWMIAGLRRAADALRRLSPESTDITKG